MGVGVRPENRLAVEAGLEVGPRGGIRVNEHLQTSDPDIYAVGDAIEVQDFVTGQPARSRWPGQPTAKDGWQPTTFSAATCITAGRKARRSFACSSVRRPSPAPRRRSCAVRGRPYRKVYIHAHHAGYYPGAQAMTLKLLFDPETGRVLGAQAVGEAGVDKRIDVLAVAIQARMTVFDLEEMELAYSPQYGSAKDPVNMAGFVAAGLLRGDHPQIDARKP